MNGGRQQRQQAKIPLWQNYGLKFLFRICSKISRTFGTRFFWKHITPPTCWIWSRFFHSVEIPCYTFNHLEVSSQWNGSQNFWPCTLAFYMLQLRISIAYDWYLETVIPFSSFPAPDFKVPLVTFLPSFFGLRKPVGTYMDSTHLAIGFLYQNYPWDASANM